MASSLSRCILLLSCLMPLQVCLASSFTDDHVARHPPQKVPVSLYYETLCPGCQQFVLEALSPIFKNGLIDIVHLRLVPWGNAVMYPNTSFVCQHGPPECFLNTVEACAIDAWPTPSAHFPFINCVENLAHEGEHTKWDTCFTKLGLNPKPVKDCSSSPHGTKLELEYGNETRELNPPLEFVPWVVVNHQPIKEDIADFTTYICKAYKGPLPSACHDKSSLKSPRQLTPRGYPVCYAAQQYNSVPAA